jgi:MFS family permease
MSYRALLRRTSPGFLSAAFLARLPYAMAPLGTLILVRSATGSYAFAGVAAGAQNLATSAGAIAFGRLTERYGLRRPGALAAVLNAMTLGGLVAASQVGRIAMFLAAVAVGLTQAQVGPLIRTHWSHLAGTERFMASALAYEAAADEAGFIVGPAAVGLLAAVGPAVPPAAAAGLLLIAALPLASRYVESGYRSNPVGRVPLPVVRLAGLAAAMGLMGAIFGVLQTGVTAAATPGAAGFLYAELGVGSAFAGLACGWLPARFGRHARYRVFAAGLVIGMSLIGLSGTLLPLPVAILGAGATIAPYMISVYALTERLAAGRVAAAMTVVGAGGPVGTALGQVIAGALVDRSGYRAAFALAPALAALALALSLAPVFVPRLVPRRVG